jgi:GMP synthase (glutamine-hydrolysing)
MKKVFAFRHVLHEHLGTIEDAFRRSMIPFEYLDLAVQPDHPVELDLASGLVLMGGPMSVNDPLPYISRELYLIDQAHRLGLPVLGVCLGAQLIAKAAGARVYRNEVKEIGWFPIQRRAEAAADPLFRHFDDTETVFQWHGETFDLPTGAVWLARSPACEHQAFRLGPKTYALQFHIEVTAAMVAEWCRQDDACGDAREAGGPIDPEENAARLAELSQGVVAEWVGLLV